MNHIERMERRLRAYGMLHRQRKPIKSMAPAPKTVPRKNDWVAKFLDSLYAAIGPLRVVPIKRIYKKR